MWGSLQQQGGYLEGAGERRVVRTLGRRREGETKGEKGGLFRGAADLPCALGSFFLVCSSKGTDFPGASE